jgi:hypothetical protein
MKYILFLFIIPLILFSSQTNENELDKELYKNCENSQESINNFSRFSRTKKGAMCRKLLKIKENNGSYKPQNIIIILDNSKQYDLGLVIANYKLELPYLIGIHRGIDIQKLSAFMAYFEYRLLPVIYLGARLGVIDVYHSPESINNNGIISELYITFNPLFYLKYFNINISAGILSYYLDDYYNIHPSFNLNLGLKISNTMRLNFELGSYNHFGFILGVLF